MAVRYAQAFTGPACAVIGYRTGRFALIAAPSHVASRIALPNLERTVGKWFGDGNA